MMTELDGRSRVTLPGKAHRRYPVHEEADDVLVLKAVARSAVSPGMARLHGREECPGRRSLVTQDQALSGRKPYAQRHWRATRQRSCGRGCCRPGASLNVRSCRESSVLNGSTTGSLLWFNLCTHAL